MYQLIIDQVSECPSVVVKIWPGPRWWHMSLTFQLSEKHQSSPVKSMLFLTPSRSSLFQDPLCSEGFSSKSSSSSNRSPVISADSYTTLPFFMFIMYNIPQRRQLWIVMDFPTCNPNKPVFVITTVTNESTCANRAVMRISPVPICLHANSSV